MWLPHGGRVIGNSRIRQAGTCAQVSVVLAVKHVVLQPLASPSLPSLTAGGHPSDDRAIVRPLGPPGHRDHQQQWQDHVQCAAAPAPGGWCLPCKDGGQVGPGCV